MDGLVGLAISLTGLWRLCATDQKRRRVFGLGAFRGVRHVEASRLLVFGPGVGLALTGDWSGFTIWFGGLSCIGWAMVAAPPTAWSRLRGAAERILR